MDDTTRTWVIIAAVVVAALLLLLVVMRGQRGRAEEAARNKARDIREQAEADRIDVPGDGHTAPAAGRHAERPLDGPDGPSRL